MKPIKLELIGFKSFFNHTVIHFKDGINCIVGPNGCGKSNIVDAIRWVLGEQAPSRIRGKSMDSVIFGGTEKFAASGMAEVSFYFENDEKNLPPQYNSYSEICITRRIFRTGESEYLINKIPSRLTDIVELFLGTGFGTRAYSIIDQGTITNFATSSPEERRLMVEEAAGITKYRNRKKVALSRLEQTENNLLRISDVIKEIDRQIAVIQKQAKKAEKYKKLKEELNRNELKRQRYELRCIIENEKNTLSEIEQLKSRENELVRQITEFESKHINISSELSEKEKAINELNNKIVSAESRLRLLENEKNYFQKEIEHLTSNNRSGTDRIAKIRERIDELLKETELKNQEKTEIENEISVHSVRIAEQEKELSEIIQKKSSVQSNLLDIQKELIEIMTEIARHSNRKNYIDSAIQENKRKTETLKIEKEQLLYQLGEQEKLYENRKEELNYILKEAENSEVKFASFTDKLMDMESQLIRAETNILNTKEKLTEAKSRYNSLVELEKNLEGFDEGIKAILKAKDENLDDKIAGGIMGLITEYIDVEPAYEKAIESVLGEKLQSLIIKEPEIGLHAIDLLKSSAAGRTTFIPVKPKFTSQNTGMPSGTGVIGPAVNFIRCEPEFQEISNALFSDVVIVDNISNALNLWSNNGFNKTLVTTDGDIIEHSGIITGGKKEKSGGQFARKREIKELKARIEEFERSLGIEQQKHINLKEEVTRLKGFIESLKEEIQSHKIRKVEIEKDISSAEEQINRIRERLNIINFETERYEKELSYNREELINIENAIKGFEVRRDELKALELSVQKELSELSTEEKIQNERLTNFRIQSASDNEKLHSVISLISRITNEQKELSYEIDILTKSISSNNIKIKELKDDISVKDKECSILIDEHRKITEEKSLLLNDYNKFSEEILNIEGHLKDIQKQIYDIKEKISALTITLNEIHFRKENIINFCQDKLNTDIRPEISDGLIMNAENLTEEEIHHTEELKRVIDNFGEINLTAIAEYENLSKRREFLQNNYDDLRRAMDNLKRAISRINRISKERFIETFNKINEKLAEVTPVLTSGGKASLRLMDESNLLEGGVDIIVNPRGKKLLSVDMLSGGEKALVGLSLVFAIYKIKPSPFCVLDEVDAPLDEVNTGRFITLIREFAKNSRFMVITHNKRTMEAANQIYGITMEEPGISKAVSLTIDQIFNEE
ncbi:MAG: chromosome segregation protein SMC [Deltaproteobacteria bacterium]|nr:chromosome segregation protein SMC [Deltaproteobacteria bacterium]